MKDRLFSTLLVLLIQPALHAAPLIEFRWNPPDGMRFSEIVRTTQTRESKGAPRRVDVSESKTEITISKSGEGWRVAFNPVGSYTIRDGRRIEDPVIGTIQKMKYEFELDGEGRVKGVRGFENIRDRLSDVIEPSRLDAVLRLVNTESMNAKYKADFHGRFGKFIGRKAEVGKGWEEPEQFTLPTGDAVKFTTATKIDERLQCGHHVCVRLLFRYDTDSESIREFLGKAVESGDAAKPGIVPDISAVRVEGGGERLIDPTTMLPQRETGRRNIRIKVKGADGGESETVLYEEREQTYEYPAGY